MPILTLQVIPENGNQMSAIGYLQFIFDNKRKRINIVSQKAYASNLNFQL